MALNNTSIVTKQVGSINDLSGVFEFVRDSLKHIALEEITKVARGGGFGGQVPVLYVDGKKSGSVDNVKTFGRIVAIAQHGPIEEAMHMAMEFVATASAQFWNPTGFYSRNFEWFMNGQQFGQRMPDVRRMGLKGNVALVQTTGYASVLEGHFLPNGILYGAAKLLQRMFGKKIAVRFSYAPPGNFAIKYPPRQRLTGFLAVPVLMIGHPTATFKQVLRQPGVRGRREKRAAANHAKRMRKLREQGVG